MCRGHESDNVKRFALYRMSDECRSRARNKRASAHTHRKRRLTEPCRQIPVGNRFGAKAASSSSLHQPLVQSAGSPCEQREDGAAARTLTSLECVTLEFERLAIEPLPHFRIAYERDEAAERQTECAERREGALEDAPRDQMREGAEAPNSCAGTEHEWV